MKNIYAVIVTYNPDVKSLVKLITILRDQCVKIIICNNSNTALPFKATDDLLFFEFGENLGIAKAQSIGMVWAFNDGADAIIQFDQDSLPEDDLVARLHCSYLKLTRQGYKIGVIGPKHFDLESNDYDSKRIKSGKSILGTSCEIVSCTLSSACLIPKEAFDIAGEMDNDLFIDLVDFEYCWRLHDLGYLTVRDNSISFGHQVGFGNKKLIGNVDIKKSAPIRFYYQTRNVLLVARRSYVPFSFKLLNIMKIFFRLFIIPFVFENKFIYLKYISLGLLDGLKGKNGKLLTK